MVWTFSSAVEKACGINASSRFSYLVLFTGQSAFRIQEWNCGCSMREVAASKFLAWISVVFIAKTKFSEQRMFKGFEKIKFASIVDTVEKDCQI